MNNSEVNRPAPAQPAQQSITQAEAAMRRNQMQVLIKNTIICMI